MLLGADRRYMHQARAVGARRQCYLFGAVGMDRVEALAAALEKNADQIDQHRGAARSGLYRRRMPQISLHGVNLTDAAKRLQMIGEIGPAHRYSDPIVSLGERPHHMTAEKGRAPM